MRVLWLISLSLYDATEQGTPLQTRSALDMLYRNVVREKKEFKMRVVDWLGFGDVRNPKHQSCFIILVDPHQVRLWVVDGEGDVSKGALWVILLRRIVFEKTFKHSEAKKAHKHKETHLTSPISDPTLKFFMWGPLPLENKGEGVTHIKNWGVPWGPLHSSCGYFFMCFFRSSTGISSVSGREHAQFVAKTWPWLCAPKIGGTLCKSWEGVKTAFFGGPATGEVCFWWLLKSTGSLTPS